MAVQVAAGFGATAEVELQEGYPVMINDPDCTAFLAETLGADMDEEAVQEIPPIMASEDFSYFLEQVPGAFSVWDAATRSGASYRAFTIRGSTSMRTSCRSASPFSPA